MAPTTGTLAITGDDDADSFPFDRAAGSLDAGHRAAVTINPGDFALFDDVDAQLVSGARESPRHGIVTRDTGARLQRCAQDRVACVRRCID
mgnify:CR=1 FL=1